MCAYVCACVCGGQRCGLGLVMGNRILMHGVLQRRRRARNWHVCAGACVRERVQMCAYVCACVCGGHSRG